jgi:hypothetical protein
MVLSSPLSPRAVKTDGTVLRFVERAGKNVPTAEKLALAKIRYQQHLLLECFDFRQLQFLFSRLLAIIDGNPELIKILGAGNLQELRQKTVSEICTVGANFRRQLQGLFTDNVFPAEDPVVLERLRKASTYFQEKIDTGLGRHVGQLRVETDNKVLGTKAKKLCKLLYEETAVKLAAVQCCAAGFSSADYLRAISAAGIETAAKNDRQRKKDRETTVTYSEADIDHPELFQILREWRATKAKAADVPAFHILHQKTLIQLVVNLPDKLETLIKIKGIGKKLSERYGEELVAIIADYREKNHIVEVILPPVNDTRPDESKKPKAPDGPKTDSRKLTLDLFEQGLTLAQIATERNLVLSTIEGHLAHFVAHGEVAVDRLLSPEKRRAIEEKLQQLPDRKLSEIKMALGDAYDYGDIKMVLAHLQSPAAND